MVAFLRCVACGEEMDEPHNHHCDPYLENKIEAARRASTDQDHNSRRLTEAQRLSLGFELMGLDGDDE